MASFGLYIHIPFCFHKCPYCDFNTYAVTSVPEHDYVASLIAELDFRAAQPAWRGREISTIFFGGGTPSLISPTGIKRVLHAAARLFPLSDTAEISLEANPGTVSLETLQGYRAAGVNRLSIGAQSFQPSHLKLLGRLHSPEQIESAVHAARQVGFRNVSIDLMHGLPSQTLEELGDDVAQAILLEPDHVSAYGLTIEKGTPLHASFVRGKLKLPPEKRLVALMEYLNEELPRRGYLRYEISNFARPGREARHNLAYWNSTEYLGLGAGAHSYLIPDQDFHRPIRWSNVALPAKYMKEVSSQGHAEAWRDQLQLKDAIFDYVYLGLRKITGFSEHEFNNRFGLLFETVYANPLEVLHENHLLRISEGYVSLTEKGLLLADSVIAEFSSPAIESATVYCASHDTRGVTVNT